MFDLVEFIGIHIDSNSIKLARFDHQEKTLAESDIEIPQGSMPGYITVLISREVHDIDPFHDADFVGLCLPAAIDKTSRVVRGCHEFPGWDHVPLAAWLEARLRRKVTLGGYGNDPSPCNCFCCLDAARLAMGHFFNHPIATNKR